MQSSAKLVNLLIGYRGGDHDKGIRLIESAQVQGVISRECWKHTDRYELDELLHLCDIALLKMFDEINITPDMNDGRIISYINKVLPGRLIDSLEPINDTLSLDDNLPDTDIPIIDTLVSRESNPEQSLMDKEMRQALAAAIKTLTPNQQRIIHMYFYEEYTQREIAEELNIKQQSVFDCIQRALATLKKILQE